MINTESVDTAFLTCYV